jgi:hypothetical protein
VNPFELQVDEGIGLPEVQLALFEDLKKSFDSTNDRADKCILFEITGYQRLDSDDDFWV